MPVPRQHFDDAARYPIFTLDRLIGIGIGTDRDRRAAVARRCELLFEQACRVRLVEKPGLEIQAGREVQVAVRRSRIAIELMTSWTKS